MPASSPLSVPARLLERARATPDASLCVVPDAVLPGGRELADQPGWWRITVREAALQVAGLADALDAAGVMSGDRVAVHASTSHSWAALDLAIQSLGAITVGLSVDLGEAELQRRTALTTPRLLLTDRPIAALGMPQLAMPGTGETALVPAPSPSLTRLGERLNQLSPDQLATLAFTAGTTRAARAASFTHAALHQAVHSGRTAFGAAAGERAVVALPMDHIHQRFATYAGTDQGVEGWYPRDLSHLPQTFRAARPHRMVASPVVLVDIRAAARRRAVERGFGALFDWACRDRDQRRGWRARAEREVADHMVFRRIRRGLGGELRSIVVGGGYLDPELAAWFRRAGIPLRNGWGIAELAAPLTASPSDSPAGTAGRPLPSVELKTSERGEIWARGPGQMLGYYGEPEATSSVLTADGWVRTGDLGERGPDGWVRLHGRLEQQVPGAPPLDLDAIDAALAGPGGTRTVTCTAPDAEGLVVYAFRPRLAHGPPDPTALRARLHAWNRTHTGSQAIVGLAILDASLAVADGSCTPTLSPVRRVIEDRYGSRVDPLDPTATSAR